MTADELTGAWVALAEEQATSGHIRVAPLMVDTPDGRVYAGRDLSGNLHLMVPVAPGTPVSPDRRSRGVTIERHELLVRGARTVFLDVVCHDDALHDVFQHLAVDLVDRIGREPGRARSIPYETLNRWRTLFERKLRALGEEQLAGLFGELHVLRITLQADPSRRVGHWTGPTGAIHDFRRGGIALEVKVSTAREGRFVQIHGSRQLDTEDDGELYLVFLRLERTDDGRSVTDLLADLRSAAVDVAELNALVARTGFQTDADNLDDDRFRVTEERWYPVDAAFPRIVHASFSAGAPPPGVLRLMYTVDLTGPSPVPLDEPARQELLRRLAEAV